MSEGSRLSRWSQRKLATKKGGALPEPDEIARVKDKKPSEQALAPDAQTDVAAEQEEMLTEADLPPIEELSAESDYTVFLKKNVPEMLRRRALRKLWVSDPVLANLDGLNDYDDDYSIVQAVTMDDTIYKIGRGFLTEDDLKESEPAIESATESLVQGEPVFSNESAAETGMEETAETDSDEPGNPLGDNAAPVPEKATQAQQVGEIESPDGSAPDSDDAKSGASSTI